MRFPFVALADCMFDTVQKNSNSFKRFLGHLTIGDLGVIKREPSRACARVERYAAVRKKRSEAVRKKMFSNSFADN
jgi:hypothetical protein